MLLVKIKKEVKIKLSINYPEEFSILEEKENSEIQTSLSTVTRNSIGLTKSKNKAYYFYYFMGIFTGFMFNYGLFSIRNRYKK